MLFIFSGLAWLFLCVLVSFIGYACMQDQAKDKYGLKLFISILLTSIILSPLAGIILGIGWYIYIYYKTKLN